MDGNVLSPNGSHDYNDDPDELPHKNMNIKSLIKLVLLQTIPEKCVAYLTSVETGK